MATDKTEENENQDIIKGGLVSMDKLLKEASNNLKLYKVSDAVSAKVERVMKNKIYVTIDDRISGIVGGKELIYDPQFARGLKVGDVVTAYVVLAEDDDGNMLLSLRKAGKDNVWASLQQKFDAKEVVSVVVAEANKGGLMIDLGGVKGFLPVSQLSAEHYPRIENPNNKDEILGRLQQLVGKTIDVKIISLERANNKLIFSEREAIGNRDIPDEIKIGDVVDGKVTGIVDFGFFVDVKGIEGLVHISEISWAKVDNVSEFVKVGDKLKLKIIDIENSRLSLSMKRLEEDPWKQLVEGFKEGDIIEGVVGKFTPFGAFVKVKSESGELDALVHISELSSKHVNDPKEILKMGEKKNFKIVTIDPAQHRLSLSLKALEENAGDKKEAKESGSEDKAAKPAKKDKKADEDTKEDEKEEKVKKEKKKEEKDDDKEEKKPKAKKKKDD